MDESTATVTLAITVTLAKDPDTTDAQGNAIPGASAEDKATAILDLFDSQVDNVRRSYDTGVTVTGKANYVGKATRDF